MVPLVRVLAAVVVLLFASSSAAANAGPVVLAAASLQQSLTAAADRFASKGHPRPVLSFAGSSALARQIEQGAPADLFISADEDWMDYLASRNLLAPGTRISFLTNRLVLVAPSAKPVTIAIRPRFPLAALLGNGRLSMADVRAVPAGKYAKAALTRLGVWQGLEGRVVQSENVRAAMTFVERGEAPLGIVYATDAKASTKVVVAGTFPAPSHPPISYPMAIVRNRTNPEATAFRAFLLSTEGRAIFVRHGFGVK